MTDRVTKMVNGLLPDGTLIRACEVTFDYLEKQDDRIAKLEAALREITWIATPDHEEARHKATEIARKALEGKDDVD
jgi:hypothetical protein